jgi:hypothetical protein
MPFAHDSTIVYDTIRDALDGLMTCTRADDMTLGKQVLERILSGIATAELIIADLTGRNPNVFYELALAHTQTKNVLLLTRNREDVPFDLRGYFCHKYSCASKASLGALASVVKAAAQDVIARRLPNVLTDPIARTQRIVDALAGRLEDARDIHKLTIRIQASISSLGNIGRPDADDPVVRAYGRLLEDERDTLIRLIERGARLRAILSPHRIPAEKDEPDADRDARLDLVIAFLRRKHESMTRCEFVIAPPSGPNLLFLGDELLFEGRKTRVAHGFGWTEVVTDHRLIASRKDIFDSLFESARDYTAVAYAALTGSRRKRLPHTELVARVLELAKLAPTG